MHGGGNMTKLKLAPVVVLIHNGRELLFLARNPTPDPPLNVRIRVAHCGTKHILGMDDGYVRS
jgi:hypothetical protein